MRNKNINNNTNNKKERTRLNNKTKNKQILLTSLNTLVHLFVH